LSASGLRGSVVVAIRMLANTGITGDSALNRRSAEHPMFSA
jgi:hypothetical protein